MTLEMQRLYLSELMEELDNLRRIMFTDNCSVKDEIMDCIVRFHRELVENKPPVCFLEFPKKDIILKYIEKRMTALWDKLPDSQAVLDGKATPEDYFTIGAYTELEKLENFIKENCSKTPFEVLESKIKIEEASACEGEPIDVSEIIFNNEK
jgi:hypothetical protein